MGSDLQSLSDHRVSDHRNRHAVIQLLQSTIESALAVQSYWHDHGVHTHYSARTWTAVPPEGTVLPQVTLDAYQRVGLSEYLRYDGPGLLSLEFGAHTVWIGTGASYLGFLVEESLRTLHVSALRSIGKALGGSRLIIFEEKTNCSDEVREAALFKNRSIDECMTTMRANLGPPQPSIQSIDPQLGRITRGYGPPVWFFEPVKSVE